MPPGRNSGREAFYIRGGHPLTYDPGDLSDPNHFGNPFQKLPLLTVPTLWQNVVKNPDRSKQFDGFSVLQEENEHRT